MATDDEYDENLIPCEFCNELYPFEEIMQHTSGCEPDLLHAPPVSNLQMSADNKVDKDTFLPPELPPLHHENKPAPKTTPVKKTVISVNKRSELEKLASKLELSEKADQEKLVQYQNKKLSEDSPIVPLEELNVETSISETTKGLDLSEDDEYTESLETFWRRAEDQLKTRIGKAVKTTH